MQLQRTGRMQDIEEILAVMVIAAYSGPAYSRNESQGERSAMPFPPFGYSQGRENPMR